MFVVIHKYFYKYYKKPEKFDNPVEFGFGGSQAYCEIPGCKNVAIIRCSWCQKSLCLKHFINEHS